MSLRLKKHGTAQLLVWVGRFNKRRSAETTHYPRQVPTNACGQLTCMHDASDCQQQHSILHQRIRRGPRMVTGGAHWWCLAGRMFPRHLCCIPGGLPFFCVTGTGINDPPMPKNHTARTPEKTQLGACEQIRKPFGPRIKKGLHLHLHLLAHIGEPRGGGHNIASNGTVIPNGLGEGPTLNRTPNQIRRGGPRKARPKTRPLWSE